MSERDLNKPSEKLQNALDEGRTLILGAQIIVGVLYRAVFEPESSEGVKRKARAKAEAE